MWASCSCSSDCLCEILATSDGIVTHQIEEKGPALNCAMREALTSEQLRAEVCSASSTARSMTIAASLAALGYGSAGSCIGLLQGYAYVAAEACHALGLTTVEQKLRWFLPDCKVGKSAGTALGPLLPALYMWNLIPTTSAEHNPSCSRCCRASITCIPSCVHWQRGQPCLFLQAEDASTSSTPADRPGGVGRGAIERTCRCFVPCQPLSLGLLLNYKLGSNRQCGPLPATVCLDS